MSKQEDEELKRLMAEATANPTIENYLALRTRFPNCDVPTDRFCTIESLISIERELRDFDIDPLTVASVLDADELAIDALSLQLLEHLLRRQQIEDGGATHTQSRRVAISDAFVDYLIVMMLGVCDAQRLAPPSSLVFLTRERLGGPNPVRYVKQGIADKKNQVIFTAAQFIARNEKISTRELARIVDVEPSTISRWFSPQELAIKAECFRDLFDNSKEPKKTNR
jgi:hypothetical protein